VIFNDWLPFFPAGGIAAKLVTGLKLMHLLVGEAGKRTLTWCIFFFQFGHCGYATGCVGGWLGGHGRWGRYVDDVGGSSADRGDRAAWRAVVDGNVDGGLCSG
jgi:hypothetical protein